MDNSNLPRERGSNNWLGIVLGIVSGAFFGILSYLLLDRNRESAITRPFQLRVWVKSEAQESEYTFSVGDQANSNAIMSKQDMVDKSVVQPERIRDAVIQYKQSPSPPPVRVIKPIAAPVPTNKPVQPVPSPTSPTLVQRMNTLTQHANTVDDPTPTALGIVVATIVYPILDVADWLNVTGNNALDQFKAGITTWAMPVVQPISRSALWADRVLGRYDIYQLIRRYAWAVIPLLVVVSLQLNNHLYYNTFLGYDMPQHYGNVVSIIHTGAMPRPPMGYAYEAHQAPLFYILAAWVIVLGDRLTGNGMIRLVPFALFVASILWALLGVVLIQRGMRHVHWLWRALTFTVIMVTPVNVMSSVMFNNDLPILVLGLWGVMIMWYMVRAGRHLERKLWLRAAAINGLCIAFKNNGVALLGIYILLAVYIAYLYYREHQRDLLNKILRISALGLPLMIVPFALNAWHTSRYVGNPIGSTSAPESMFYAVRLSFFTSFDTSIFDKPFAFGPGESSYWSLQYVTMYSDYYDHWRSAAYQSLPSSAVRKDPQPPMPIENFNTAILLEYLAIPVTLLMVFGFVYSLYRVIRNPRRGLRDGSIVVVLVTVVTEAAQLVRFAFYANIRDVVIHARYLGFMYPFLLLVGIYWLWHLSMRRRGIFNAALAAFLSVSMIAFSFVAIKLLWLPPLF